MTQSAKPAFASSIRWQSVNVVTQVVLQLIFIVLLARLISKADFGLMSIALVVVGFVEIFAQIGIGPSLIQRGDLKPEQIRAAFSFSVVLGCVFFVLTYAMAPTVGQWFESAELASVLRWIALSFILSSLALIPRSLLIRNMAFKNLFIASLVSMVIGNLVIGLGMAYAGYGVWSYVGALLSQNAALGVMYWLFKPAEAHGAWKPQSWRPLAPMLSYGGRATLYNLLNYASSKVDTVLVGHHAQTGSTGALDNTNAATNGWTTTGLYDRSAYLMSLPVSILGKLGDSVLFSGMSAIQNEKDALQSVLRRALGLIAWLTFPGSLALAWFAGDVAALLLGEPYAEAEPIVRVLFIGVAFRSMIKLADALIRAVDALNVAILIKSIYLIGLGLSSWFVLSVGWGIEGVAWSVTIWTVVQFIFLSAWALRSAEWNLLDAIRSIVPGIKSLLIASALIGILSQALHYTMALYVPSASPLTIHLAHATLAIISTIIALFAAAVLHPEVVDGGDLELRKRWTAYLPLRLQNRIL
jgi:O-antigen/teichoic acid export membrane protein